MDQVPYGNVGKTRQAFVLRGGGHLVADPVVGIQVVEPERQDRNRDLILFVLTPLAGDGLVTSPRC